MTTFIRTCHVPAQHALANWDPFHTMRSMFGWGPFEDRPEAEPTFVPRFDAHETAKEYVFRADLPGVRKEDVQLTLTGDELRVAGHRESAKLDETDHAYLSERHHGAFERVFELPEAVDSDQIHAEMKDGILTITIPKKPETQPRQIPVAAA